MTGQGGDDISRLGPRHPEAEAAIVAACLASATELDGVRGWLEAADFWDTGLGLIYQVVRLLAERGQPITLEAAAEVLGQSGVDAADARERVLRAAAAEHSCHEAAAHADLVLHAALKRAWLGYASEILERGSDPGQHWVELVHWAPEALAELQGQQWERQALVPVGHHAPAADAACARCEIGRGPEAPAPVLSAGFATPAAACRDRQAEAEARIEPPPPPTARQSRPAAGSPGEGIAGADRRHPADAARRCLASLEYASPRLRRAIETWQRRHPGRMLAQPTNLREALLGTAPGPGAPDYPAYEAIVSSLAAEREWHLRTRSAAPPRLEGRP